MIAKLLAIGLGLLLAVGVPTQAQDEAQPDAEDCPAVQVMPHEPYVLIVPECLDDTVAPATGQV